jgi:hypothetical protein
MASCNNFVLMASTTNATSYTTASLGVVANELVVVFTGASGTIADGTVTDSLGGTYTLQDSSQKSAGADEGHLWVRDSLIPSTTSMTITFDCTGDAATGLILAAIRITGMSRVGASAVRQVAHQDAQSGGTTPAPAFPAACLTGNPTIGFIFNETNPAGMTPPTNWTELTADVGHSQPTTGGEYCIRNSGFTGTTITWGSTSASEYLSMIVELDTSAAPSGRRIFVVN